MIILHFWLEHLVHVHKAYNSIFLAALDLLFDIIHLTMDKRSLVKFIAVHNWQTALFTDPAFHILQYAKCVLTCEGMIQFK